ncbi:MAG: calcineurin-like phosphoesterase family protein [Tannerellaceae bacterium]|jgi:3',5'-cyclic AMP phosphodiesterase CpdA|nr:calcineurin-like phosphoesterase family protein [Tannerellaceae bacterium]
MKRTLYTGLLALLAAAGVSGQTSVTGYVYEDVNGNGKKDRKEKGIAQVAVSNGKEVALTDASGKYQLPAGRDNIIFVIKPAGYVPALDEFNLPKFYYIHKPDGSPETFYKGVTPTPKLPASVDFALHTSDEPESFTALIFGDTQPYNEQEIDYLRRGIVAETENIRGVSFGITLGDLVGDNLTLHLPYKQTIRQVGIPWYNVMGNHDMNYDTREDRLSDEAFEAHFGPNNYAFNYGKAHFIVLDDILYPHPLTGKGYWGGLRDDQLAFVENDLAYVPKENLLVFAIHIPFVDSEEAGAFRDSDRQKLYALLQDYPNVLFLSAHTHFQEQHFIGKGQGVDREKPIHEYNVGATCGDWYSGPLNEWGIPVSTMRDGTPSGYAFLRIDGNRYVLDYKVSGMPADHQIAVYHPKVVPFRQSTSASLYANFFMGSPDNTVEYRVDGGEWTRMQRVEEFDPGYCRYVQDWDYLDKLVPGRRPSNPTPCRHLWKGKMMTGLPVGQHQIEVRATDMFGRVFSEKSAYRIASPEK